MAWDFRTQRIEERNVEKVARRHRWWGNDGRLSASAELVLGRCESAAAPLLQSVAANWPLDRHARATLAQFFAIHSVRGPAWRADYERVSMEAIADVLAQQRWGPELERRAVTEFLGDRMRVEALLKQIPRMASLLASMHWSLVVFEDDLIASCDQPVVVVPLLGDRQIGPIEAVPRAGFMNTVEVRIPLDPSHVLLLTWLDEPDGSGSMVGGFKHAADVNRSTYAQADLHWFYRPGSHPPRISPPMIDTACEPISYDLLPTYSANAARNSRRRAEADNVMRELVESQATDMMRWVTVTHRPSLAPA